MEAGVKMSTVKRIVLQKDGQPLGLGIVAAKVNHLKFVPLRLKISAGF